MPAVLPVTGRIADATVGGAALRHAARPVPHAVLLAAGPGEPAAARPPARGPRSPGVTRRAYRCAVPDKRRESKNRRATRNKAQRGALAARRENAAVTTTTTRASASATGSKGGGGRAAGARTVAGPGSAAPPPEGGLLGLARSSRPGDRAVLAALVLAVMGALVMLFAPIVKVDDRGEPLPRQFGGVATMAREAATGHAVPEKTTTLLSAQGPQILLVAIVPVLVVGFAVWANRRPDRSRFLTYSMIVMAGMALFLGVYFLPALIAMFFAGYQVRRADMPARVAERATARGRGRGEVIDVESAEADAGGDDEPAAEVEPEDTTDAGDEPADSQGNGSGARKRRR